MAITRAQYLQGNQSQGPVLPGQVQGVKPGPGTAIAADGTISVDPSTITGLVRLNDNGAYNDYVWPLAKGAAKSFLATDGDGGLLWANPSISAAASLNPSPPSNPLDGQLWYDPVERYLKIYESIVGGPSWRPVSRGNEVVATNVTASPAFTAGDGSVSSPFFGDTATIISGSFGRLVNTITITGLSPYQYVPIKDSNELANNYRILPSNEFADETGTLTFDVYFFDKPTTIPSRSFNIVLRVGYNPVYITLNANVVPQLSLTTAGTISGTPQIGQSLTYNVGSATGGDPNYTYTWKWIRQSDQSVLQTGGQFFTVPSLLAGDRVQVELTVVDENLTTLTGLTAPYPASPATLIRGPFLTDIAYPTTTTSYATTAWVDTSTTLNASGCIEFTTGDPANVGTVWSQGPTPITNGGQISTRWMAGATCSDSFLPAPTLTGCVYDAENEDCGSLTMVRVPNPFSFATQTNKIPSTVVTSNSIKPLGFNTRAYVSYSANSTASAIQASVDGGVTWTNLPLLGNNTFPIDPGQSLQVRMTLGSEISKTYNAIINIGYGPVAQSGLFTVSTVGSGTFNTALAFPSTTYVAGPPVVGVASSAAWIDGNKTISVSSSPYNTIEYQVVRGATVVQSWTTGSFAVINGDIIQTRWKTSVTNAAAHGATITGGLTDGVLTTLGTIVIDRIPEQFSFQDIDGQGTNTQATSTTIFIKGNNAPAYVTLGTTPSPLSSLSTVQANIGGTGWVTVPSSGTTMTIDPVESGSGYTFQLRGTTGASTNTSYAAVINMGGTGGFVLSDIWEVLTTVGTPTVSTPSIVTPVNGATGLNPDAVSPAGLTITSSAYSAFNNAGTHLSSDWEIRKDSSTGTIVYSTVGSTANLTSIFVPKVSGSVTVFEPNTNYFVKVRYNSSSSVISSWSNWSQFSTLPTSSLVWSSRFAIGSYNSFRSVVAGTAGFWMNGDDYLSSADGITWSSVNYPGLKPSSGFVTNADYNQYATGLNQIWAAGGGNGIYNGPPKLAYKDGNTLNATWTNAAITGIPTSSSGMALTAVAANTNTIVVGNQQGGLYYSTNLGSTFSTGVAAVGPAKEITKLIWTGTQFIASRKDGRIYRSVDGVTWSFAQVSTTENVNDVSFLSGTYLAITPTTLFRSTDGINWTQITGPAGTYQVLGSGGVWFVLGTNGNIFSSIDAGNTWTANSGGTIYSGNQKTDIAYNSKLSRFVMSIFGMYLISTQ